MVERDSSQNPAAAIANPVVEAAILDPRNGRGPISCFIFAVPAASK